MEFAVCDDDPVFLDIIGDVVTGAGHEVVGVASTPAAGVALLRKVRPAAVVVDITMGFGSDFDVLATAEELGIAAVVFSPGMEQGMLAGHDPRPEIAAKPHFDQLGAAIARLVAGGRVEAEGVERRSRPQRAAQGRPSSDVADVQAFYESLNAAEPGDALVDLALPFTATSSEAAELGRRLTGMVRSTDRLLAWGSGVRIFLPGADREGRDAVLGRVQAAAPPPEGTHTTAIIVEDGETGSDAYERLRREVTGSS